MDKEKCKIILDEVGMFHVKNLETGSDVCFTPYLEIAKAAKEVFDRRGVGGYATT